MEEDPTQRGLFDFDDGSEDDLYSDDDFDDDELDDEDDRYEDCFGLVAHDKPVIDRLIDCVRKLVARPDVTAYQLHGLAALLFGLERLPTPTPGVDMILDVGRRYPNGESRFWEVRLSEQEFRLESQSYIILDPQMGGDSLCSSVFEAEVGGYRSLDNPFALVGWLEEFEAACADLAETVDVSSLDDGPSDWDDEPDPDRWDGLDGDGGWFAAWGNWTPGP